MANLALTGLIVATQDVHCKICYLRHYQIAARIKSLLVIFSPFVNQPLVQGNIAHRIPWLLAPLRNHVLRQWRHFLPLAQPKIKIFPVSK